MELSQPRAIRSALPMYQNVRIVGLNCTGTVILNCVHNVIFAGGRIRSPYPGFWGIGERCRNINILDVDTEDKIFTLKS